MATNLKLYDFQFFGFTTWFFAALCLLRAIVDSFQVERLDRYSKIIDRNGLKGLLVSFLLLGPVSMFISTDFEMAFHSFQANSLIYYSPRTFFCLMAVAFGWAAAISAEGTVFLVWLIFRRRQVTEIFAKQETTTGQSG